MKTALALALTAVASVAFASTPPQNVRQDVQRLTLLPGPYLTSPAKNAPQPQAVNTVEAGMVRMGNDAPEFTFQAGPPPSTPTTGEVRLGTAGEKRKDFAPTPKPSTPRDPDTLKFEAQLPPTSRPSLLEPKKAKPADDSPEKK